jgi:hypothetical protein
VTLPAIEQLHAGLHDLLLERLEFEPVILGARVGMGSEVLARAMVRDTTGFTLDPVASGGDRQLLVEDLTRDVFHSIQELPVQALAHADRESERARLELASHYGKDFTLAMSAAAGHGTDETRDDWTIARALGPESRGTLVAVRDAHRLAKPAMWELRDLANTGVRLLLLTTPEHRTRMHAREAPFYGMSSYIEMPTLPLANWTTRLGADIHPEILGELLRQTRYRTALTLEILERHQQRPSPDIGTAWFRAVDARDTEARSVLALSRSVHELAPRLLVALARDEAPYARSSERSDRIALALRRLRENDLIEQPDPRRWQIADPLLRAAIRRLQPGYVEIYPEISQLWS